MSSSSTPPPTLHVDVDMELDPGRRWVHDMKGPISVIRGHARLLALGRRGELTDEQRRSVASIDKQVDRLERLLERLEAAGSPDLAPSSILSGVFPIDVLCRPRILVADDDEGVLGLVRELLSSRYEISFARDGREALASLGSEAFHLAIIDLHLPVLDGFELVAALRAAALPWTPALMILSAESDPHTKVKALALGAVDYVTKPFDPEELAARVARVVAIVSREASLRADAFTDSLTGLANYRSLSESLEREIERARRYRHPLSLITIDLDHLKTINDEHGHDAGDHAICVVAQVLKATVRRFEMVARQGGDEFAVLLPNTNAQEAEQLAERLRAEVASRNVKGIALSASIGVASRDAEHDLDAKMLVKASDEALYRAKYAGRGRVEMAREG
jgi:two-component system chemotaxis response regulator CheY